MLVISPPSQHNASGTYNFVIVSPMADSDWPSNGLSGMSSFHHLLDSLTSMMLGHLVVQLCLVFRVLGTDTFLAYVQCFNVTAPNAASGLCGLKHAVRTNGMHIGDIIPLSHVCSPTHIILHFGKAANARLNSHISYEFSLEFWLNKYWTKQFYYCLCPS